MFGIADHGVVCAAILLFLALSGADTSALLTPIGKVGLHAGATTTKSKVILAGQVLSRLATADVAARRRARPAGLEAAHTLGAACADWIVLRLLRARVDVLGAPVRSKPRHARLQQVQPIKWPNP